MVWSFPRDERVGMSWIQAEVVAAILQGEAPARWDDAGSEAHIVAIDKGAGVPVAIDHTQIDCV